MTREQRHLSRLVMRVAYTGTGFLSGVLFAAIAHDGLAPAGGLLPPHQAYLFAACATWALAVVLDGLTSEPGHK